MRDAARRRRRPSRALLHNLSARPPTVQHCVHSPAGEGGRLRGTPRLKCARRTVLVGCDTRGRVFRLALVACTPCNDVQQLRSRALRPARGAAQAVCGTSSTACARAPRRAAGAASRGHRLFFVRLSRRRGCAAGRRRQSERAAARRRGWRPGCGASPTGHRAAVLAQRGRKRQLRAPGG